MNIFLGTILVVAGLAIRSWYGYGKGKQNPVYWRPIHSNTIANFVVLFGTLGLMVYGIILIFN